MALPACCFLSITLVSQSFVLPAAGHQFEDGVIERMIAVRIRDDVGTIEYSIGLNDATMKAFMATWPNDQALRESFQKKSHQSSGNSQLVETLPPGTKKTASPEQSLPDQDNQLIEGELVNELELVRAFGEMATPHLQIGLQLFIGDDPLDLKLLSVTPSPRHHATLQTRWQFRLPDDEILRLSISDNNFLQHPGGTRYALKTSGSSMILQSNVAPILIRSSRTILDGVSVSQRLKAVGIETRIRRFRPSTPTLPSSSDRHPPSEDPLPTTLHK